MFIKLSLYKLIKEAAQDGKIFGLAGAGSEGVQYLIHTVKKSTSISDKRNR